MLNFSDIVSSASQKPDAGGNLVPADTAFGSATLSGIHDNIDPIDAALSVASFDPCHATCTPLRPVRSRGRIRRRPSIHHLQ